MPTRRIDFKQVRTTASFATVLEHYGITLEKDGSKEDQFRCLCPFHDDQEPSMKVNTDRNIYNCFPCDQGGNILDFVMAMEDCTIRPAALKVTEICRLGGSAGGSLKKPKKAKTAAPKQKKKPSKPVTSKRQEDLDGEPYNRPLTFTLQNLATDHTFIAERGITQEQCAEFGLGIAQKGMMKGRLVFPIHNAQGELVAYCGRYVGKKRPKDEPKYRLPPNFHKEIELFNWHRAAPMTDRPLILVESFLSAVRLHSLGHRVVSIMGRSLSERQLTMLQTADVNEVVLLLDGDDPGREAVITIGRTLLEASVRCSAPVVSKSFKPHQIDEATLALVLAS